MAIKINLEFSLAGDTEDTVRRVTADLRDMRAWERANKGQAFAIDNPDMGRMTFLAWSAARRAQAFTGSWMEFDAICTSVEVTEEEEVIPTLRIAGGS